MPFRLLDPGSRDAVRADHLRLAQLHEVGMWHCSDCALDLPLTDFYIRGSGKGAGKPVAGYCKPHIAVRGKQQKRRWQFGLAPGAYEALLLAQGGVCKLCGTDTPGGRGDFHVDHDHSCCSGKTTCGKCVRGLLCVKCNSAIGFFNDDPDLMRKAIRYVESR